MEIASLVIGVDARPAKKAGEELSKLVKQSAATEKAVDGVSDALTDAAKAAGVYRDASGKLREANGRFVSDARKVELGLEAVSENAKKASKSVKGLGDGAGSASTYLKTMATAAVAAFSVAAIVEFTRRTSVAIAEIERFAQLSNTTNEQFQKAAYAAARFGVEQEKLSDILKDTNDKFGDFFQTGAGPLADFFEQIAPRVGITADAFRGLSGADALGLYVKTLEQAGVNQQDMTFYLEALASDATLLQGVFKDGGAALAAYSAEAENLGIILGDQTIAQAREFQNQLASVNAILGNAGKTITAEMLPALSAITTMFMNAIKESGGMGNAVSNAVDKSVKALAFILDAADAVTRVFGVIGRAGAVAFLALKSGAMDVAASIIEGPLDALNYLIRGFNELGRYIGTTFNEIEPPKFAQELRQEAANAASAARIGMDDIQSILMEPLAGRTFIDLYEQAQQVGASLEVAGAAATNATAPFKRLGEEAGSASKEVVKLNKAAADGDHDAAAKAIEDYRKEVEQLEDRLDPVGKATKQYQKDVALLASAHERGELSGEKYALMLKNLEEDYKKASESSSDWGQFTQRALDSVDQAFADAWKNIDQGFSGFADGLKNAFKNMLAELAHMAITKPIIVQLSSMLGIGGAQQQGQGGGLLSSIAGMFGGGGNNSTGSGLGDAFSTFKNIYSMYQSATGEGFLGQVASGFQSGGFQGALSGGGKYISGIYDGITGALGSYFGGAAYSAATSAAIQTGLTQGAAQFGSQFAINAGAQVVFPGAASAATGAATGAAATTVGANSGVMAALASNPVGWFIAAITGVFQANKLFSQGVTADGSKLRDEFGGGGARGMFGQSAGFLSDLYETQDKIVGSVIGDRAANILSGGPVIQALSSAVGNALFGGNWQTKNFGYELGATGGGLTARQFEDQKKKGGLFSSSKSRTKYKELDPETMGAFQDMYDATKVGVSDLFSVLGFSIEESSLAGLSVAKKKIKTKGKTEEEIQLAIAEWFGTAAEAMSAELNKVFGTGLDYDLAGMQAFVGNLQGVNAILERLRLEAFDTSVAGGKLAESLSAAAGGLEALTNNTATYYGAFFSAAEQLEDQLGAIKKAFEDADVEMVSSRQEYRDMVEDIDLTTEAGQQMFATMMQLSGTAAQYFDILEAQAQAAAQAAQASLLGSVSGAYGQLQRSIQMERDRLTQNYQAQIAAEQAAVQARTNAYADMIDTANSNVQAMRNLDSALSRALSTLLGTSETAVQMVRKQAVELLQDAVNIGRSGRSVSAISGLEDALDSASRLDTDVYSTLADFEREQGRTANLISELQGINGKQLTTEEKLLEQLRANSIAVQNSIAGVTDAITAEYERAMQALEEELTAAQAQLDALNGIDNSVLSVAAAVAQMSAAVTAAINGMTGGEGLADTIKGLYLSILGTNANQQGVDFWSNRIGEGGNFTELVKELQQAAFGKVGTQNAIADLYKQSGTTVDAQGLAFWEQAISSGQYTYDDLRAGLGIPGFASGGMHSGGVRLVGENGPEIEVTGPSRIYSANQTASMLAGGSEQAEEVRIAMSDIMNGLRAIAKNTMKTASGIERQNQIGVPDQGVIA